MRKDIDYSGHRILLVSIHTPPWGRDTTTQVYAKVLDEGRKNAVDAIPSI